MTIFHKITKSAKLVILLIIPTYAKVSLILKSCQRFWSDKILLALFKNNH
ncbi:hypothetical protein BSPLISOX_658 [uncultured Gammaproteobacteria bacterium]|nr:hypothetical protein [uncultured Gammaproteobacteria bacterium]VVH65474.1 hypothetical protein BSPLISOX_658 [uncultured Gammaproteobacteria bacterium]